MVSGVGLEHIEWELDRVYRFIFYFLFVFLTHLSILIKVADATLLIEIIYTAYAIGPHSISNSNLVECVK
jgi:hypothetical protein